MIPQQQLQQFIRRLDEVNELLCDPAVLGDPKQLRELNLNGCDAIRGAPARTRSPQRPQAAWRSQALATGSPARRAASSSDVPWGTRTLSPEGSKRTAHQRRCGVVAVSAAVCEVCTMLR